VACCATLLTGESACCICLGGLCWSCAAEMQEVDDAVRCANQHKSTAAHVLHSTALRCVLHCTALLLRQAIGLCCKQRCELEQASIPQKLSFLGKLFG
jgi:hypothetical protein